MRYDDTKHVDIRAPMEVLLSELLVTPGEQVNSGTSCWLCCKCGRLGNLGLRFSSVSNNSKSQISNFNVKRPLAENLALLSSMLDQGNPWNPSRPISRTFRLGAIRQEILSAYSKMRLSAELLAKIEPLANSGRCLASPSRAGIRTADFRENAFRSARDQATLRPINLD